MVDDPCTPVRPHYYTKKASSYIHFSLHMLLFCMDFFYSYNVDFTSFYNLFVR